MHTANSRLINSSSPLTGWQSQLGAGGADVLDQMSQDEIPVDVHLAIVGVILTLHILVVVALLRALMREVGLIESV